MMPKLGKLTLVLALLVVALACSSRADAAAVPPSATQAGEEDSVSAEWNPMELVAHLPMAVRVTPMPSVAPLIGISEAALADIVTAHLREHDIPVADFSPGSPLPHLLATLRVVAFQPRDQRYRPAATFVLSLDVRDPIIVDCLQDKYVLALIWQRGSVGFTSWEQYPETVSSSLAKLTEEFVRDYLEASGAVPRGNHAARIENQYACVTS